MMYYAYVIYIKMFLMDDNNTSGRIYKKLINTGHLLGRSKYIPSNSTSKYLPQENKLTHGGSLYHVYN